MCLKCSYSVTSECMHNYLSLAQKPQFAVASYQKVTAEAIYKLIARGTAFEGKQKMLNTHEQA